MPKLIVVRRNGEECEVEGQSGMSVMELIRHNGIDELLALCGGCCSCATCHIHVDSAFSDRLSVMEANENDLLDGSENRDGFSRLSCQIAYGPELDGLRVVIAQED